MPGPSDIRVNPFNNATNYVNLTERHIVPSVSPFVVRLNEVPEKQDPSNMQMYYVDDTTGRTTETALTEVAATPGAGEFRPDYSTNAFDDTSWNTGLIEFSSADAGKIIEVSYTATGTLAGVKTNRYPAWWLDRGDGSDGDFVPTEDTTISGVKNYKSVFIKEGVTINIQKYVRIKCLNGFINNGNIIADGQGAAGGAAGGYGKYNNGEDGYSSVGGAGGGISSGGAGGGIGHSIAIMPIEQMELPYGAGGGSGGTAQADGGSGGAGGGAICITAAEIFNYGNMTAKGADGGIEGKWQGGGGGGGSITLIANTILRGSLNVDGGKSDYGSFNGADGGNGITRVIEIGV